MPNLKSEGNLWPGVFIFEDRGCGDLEGGVGVARQKLEPPCTAQ